MQVRRDAGARRSAAVLQDTQEPRQGVQPQPRPWRVTQQAALIRLLRPAARAARGLGRRRRLRGGHLDAAGVLQSGGCAECSPKPFTY